MGMGSGLRVGSKSVVCAGICGWRLGFQGFAELTATVSGLRSGVCRSDDVYEAPTTVHAPRSFRSWGSGWRGLFSPMNVRWACFFSSGMVEEPPLPVDVYHARARVNLSSESSNGISSPYFYSKHVFSS